MYKGFQFQTGESYLAKPLGMCYCVLGKNNSPALKVMFKLDTEEGPKNCEWTAWMTPKAMDANVEKITNLLGWNGNEDTTDKGIFTDKDLFDWDREVKVTVKYNDSGYPEIEWVNSLGGSAKFAGAKPVQAREGMKKIGLRAAYISAQKKIGAKPVQNQNSTTTPKKEVPF